MTTSVSNESRFALSGILKDDKERPSRDKSVKRVSFNDVPSVTSYEVDKFVSKNKRDCIRKIFAEIEAGRVAFNQKLHALSVQPVDKDPMEAQDGFIYQYGVIYVVAHLVLALIFTSVIMKVNETKHSL